ncbi:MAG: hypothetical protein ACRC9L_03470 [Brevinema sp.]
MGKAMVYGFISLIVGGTLAFFNPGMGIVVAISIVGVGIIHSNESK